MYGATNAQTFLEKHYRKVEIHVYTYIYLRLYIYMNTRGYIYI
jgi:hypothetical protein